MPRKNGLQVPCPTPEQRLARRERALYYAEGGTRERHNAARLLKDEQGVKKLTPREHCIQRIRSNIARRIKCSLAHPDQINARRRRQRERRRRRKLKGGDDDDGAGEGDETVA
jgi:hypothetical protein